MNEPWRSISAQVRTVGNLQHRHTIAQDRLGFRRVSTATTPLPKEISTVKQTRLLLVEDSDDAAFLFSTAVRKSGRAVIVDRAASAEEARELLSDYHPSLIALDCHLPGASGLELLREIRRRTAFRRVPVVIVSGSQSDADIESAYAYGANSFLRKPLSFEEHLECVRLLLDYWLDKNCTSLSQFGVPGCVWLG